MNIAVATRSDVLRGRVLKAHRNSYEQLLSRRSTLDIHYLLEVGVAKDLEGLAAAAKAIGSPSESLVAMLFRKLGWRYFTPSEFAEVVELQLSRGQSGFHLSYALESGRLIDNATDDQLYQLSRALVVRTARRRSRPGRSVDAHGKADDRRVEMTVGALAAMTNRPASGRSERIARLCLVLWRVLNDHDVGTSDTHSLRTALAANTAVRRALLSMAARRAGQDQAALWRVVSGFDAICTFDAEDVEELGNPLLRLVYEEVEAARMAQLARQPRRPARAVRDERLKVGAQAKRQLREMLPRLQDGTATNGLAWVASWLLSTTTGSRHGEVQFAAFEREVGVDIARAVKLGFGQVWRKQPPQYDEETPGTTYYITIAGLQGLHLELGEGRQLPSLSDDEVRSALRYGVFEINGFPKWFWRLAEVHQTVAMEELNRVANGVAEGAVSRQHTEELLTALDDAPDAFRRVLAPKAWNFLLETESLRPYVVERLLDVVHDTSEAVSRKRLGRAALAKLKKAFRSPLPSRPDDTVKAQQEQGIRWAARWLLSLPRDFERAVGRWGPQDPGAVELFLVQLAAHFGADRRGALAQVARASDEGVSALATLYRWTRWAVPPDKDVEHPEGQAFSPTRRDHAAQFRDDLIPAIASARSQRAYEALEGMRKESTGPRAMYLQQVQFAMREAQYERPPLQQSEYDSFEQDLKADVTDAISFAMTLHSDLLEVKYDIEKGEFSLRRFFSDLAFRRRSNQEGTSAMGLALEADFQRLLASELHHQAKGRYSVAVEPHTAEGTRRDIMCTRGTLRASVELKMSLRWTLDDFLQALEGQLVGQYMRNRAATTGFLVVVLQQKNRQWKNHVTGKMVDFTGLLEVLRSKAADLESQDRRRYLRVIGIDATPPSSFREQAKMPPVPRRAKRKR